MVDFSIIVVSYRSGEDIESLLGTIDAAVDGASWHMTIVNNAVDDDLGESLRPDPRITIVDAPGNLGYSGGINLGGRSAPPSRITVVLNPDLTLAPGSLARLDAALDAGAHAAVPRMLDTDGVRQDSLRREPTLRRALGDALFGARWKSRPGFLAETVYSPATYEVTHSVEWATGATLALRTATLQSIGEWDERTFFMYSEETDYSRRIRDAHGRIAYVPDAVVTHRAGGSGRSPLLDALLEVNKIRYYRKWHGSARAVPFGLVVLLRNALRLHQPGSRAAARAILSRSARRRLPGGER